MTVIKALQTGTSALRRNPSIAGIILAFSLLQLPTQFAQLAGPLASAVLGIGVSLLSILLIPFIFAGLLGMADEALDGKTDFSTFVETGKRYYTSMLGAYLLVFAGSIILGIIAFIAFSVFGIAVFAAFGGTSGAGFSGSALVGIVLAVVVGVLLMFVPLFFIQFYGQAIVLDERGAIGGLKRSISLVRRNLRSVFGYSILVFGVGLVFGLFSSIPSTLLSIQTAQPSPATGFSEVPLLIIAGLSIVGTVLMGLVGSLFLTFSVAFYRALSSVTNTDDPSTPQGTIAQS